MRRDNGRLLAAVVLGVGMAGCTTGRPAPSPEAAATPAPAPTERTAAAIPAVRLSFDHGSADLTRWDRGSLREVAETWRRHGGRLKVVGHANQPTQARTAFNHKMANFSISLQRAARIRDQLVRYGVDPRAIDVTALSDTLPAPAAVGMAADPRNRRADIYLIR